MRRIILLILVTAALVCAVSCAERDHSAPPGEAQITSGETQLTEKICTFSIECSNVFEHSGDLDPAVAEYIPDDGVILAQTSVSFTDGETVCDVLRRVCTENGIAFETTGSMGSVYVEGIGHLYEFDCGDGSGWLYRVNGEYPNYGCDSCVLNPGDKVEWRYTCDFGVDVGGPESH